MRNAELHFHDLNPTLGSFRDDVLAGLRAERRQIPPKYFYDEAGSRPFDPLTEWPENYPTRTETPTRERHRQRLSRPAAPGSVLLEWARGTSYKRPVRLQPWPSTPYLPIASPRGTLR